MVPDRKYLLDSIIGRLRAICLNGEGSFEKANDSLLTCKGAPKHAVMNICRRQNGLERLYSKLLNSYEGGYIESFILHREALRCKEFRYREGTP